MNIEELVSEVESEIPQIKKENLQQKNEIEEITLNFERKTDSLLSEIISIIDAYEKAEDKVKELGLEEDEKVQKAMKRLLQPKKVALSVLSKYGVSQIDLLGKILNEDLCTVVETEPDNEKENDTVISIEKNGYVRGERLIRRAEVIVVKN